MNGLQLIERAVARWIDGEGTRSTYLLCQRFDGWYVSRVQQSAGALTAYPSAIAAYRASSIYQTSGVNDPDIRPGDSLYFTYGVYGHVVTAVGRDLRNGRLLVSQTANAGTVVRRLRRNVKIVYADTVGLPFLGASRRNGVNPAREGITAWNIGGTTAGTETPSATLPAEPLEGNMAVYVRAQNDARVFEITGGKKYYLSKQAWKAVTTAFAAAGAKVPYSRARLTKAEVDAIPNG